MAGLIQAPDGNFYGATTSKAAGPRKDIGTYFQITPSGVLTIIFRFNQKENSDQSLLYYQGSLFGVSAGDFKYMPGAIFARNESAKGKWTRTVLHAFALNGSDGYLPRAPLILGADGLLYGTTGQSAITD